MSENNKTYSADANHKIIKENVDSAWLHYVKAAVPDRKCSFSKQILSMPVAVLIGPGTASSGEIMALSFTTRNNTRLFGEPTIGVASVANGFIIGSKGYLLLTVAYVADARKKVLDKKFVRPNTFVKCTNDNYVEPAKDETVQEGMKWLMSKLK